ncbi:uncharacterized protein K444DRAFT_400042 [Hyaloscypha bicolor E]|uniref:Uncharacterized protein n=1 Tax=Hyaloscypha bicolor E TaxID=1095630 RepID=A0A2J6TBC8_9HELO|nr:uncharacterized protein K444DRAFT_400042 [Hyaloscypha bicolor E]PMD60272.1 hypothetical protein K444DRAFT_400042 [Hyaloscypha bicolor E]
MDESKIRLSCHHNSFYIPLDERDQEKSSRQAVSAVHTTHVHFVVQYEQHWAAVQLSISPFALAAFPGQTFYSSHFRYSLCCHPPPRHDLINSVVQRIYDARFHPSPWNFSVKSCGTHEPRGLNCGAADITCAKKAEEALLAHIKDPDIPAPPRDSNIEFPSRNKRRRRGDSHLSSGDDSDNQDADEGDPTEESAADDEHPGPAEQRQRRTGLQKNKTRSVAKKPYDPVRIIANKIRNGITMKRDQIRNRQVAPALLDTSTNQPESPQAKDVTHIEPMMEPVTQQVAEHYIDRIWDRTVQQVKVTEDDGWKIMFYCSCLRTYFNIRTNDKSKLRWMNAARIINSIVNGLWEHWGPHALYVYEALAGKQRTIFWGG